MNERNQSDRASAPPSAPANEGDKPVKPAADKPKPAPKGPQEPEVKLLVSTSPHILDEKSSIENQMYTVVAALVPAGIAGVVLFGLPALSVTVLSVGFCVAVEAAYLYWFQPRAPLWRTVLDGSAIVTGLLLAYNLPSSAPWWMIAVGAVVAMLLGKHLFGGLGQNPFNPALVARVFLLIAFPVQMTNWPKAGEGLYSLFAFDTVTSATPLGVLKTDGLAAASRIDLLQIALGTTGGCIGEVSVIALLLGGLFMLWRKVIRWHIPLAYIGTVAGMALIFWLVNPEVYANPLFHVVSGGLILGAFFMATDLVTSPLAPSGMLVFGVGCGLLTYIIRAWGGYPEGVSFAILIMNAFVPLIDRFCRPRRFGMAAALGVGKAGA